MQKVVMGIGLLFLTNMVNAETTVGELELIESGKTEQLALLLNTEITGNVNGLIASINVKQTFKNNIDGWVNGRYVFPLPEGAAVDSFKMRIGERVINGLIKEKEQAQKEFEAAKRSGKKAGLLKQHRPNMFSISVANIGPNEQVETELTFVETVQYEGDTFSLRLPTTITPRYIPGKTISPEQVQKIEQVLDDKIEQALKEQQNVKINTGSGWAANTTRVIDANDITPPQTHSIGDQASHKFSLALSVNAGISLQSITSETHGISSNNLSDNSVEVVLANGLEKLDSDLVLQWQAISGAAPQAAFFQQKYQEAYYSMLMLMPPQVNTSLALPRDVTFIIDTSGSMSGGSMRQAKQALKDGLGYLNAGDVFNVIEFNSDFSSLFLSSQMVTNTTLNEAHKMVDRLSANGGTEMLEPLRYALNSKSDSSYLKQVIFITDGSIGNESELFAMIKRNLKDTRLFTVGIGSAPNTYFMSKAAQFGRGTSTIINNLAKVKVEMEGLFKKINSPVMRDIKITWPETSNTEMYPNNVADLYAGQPLTVIVKSTTPISKAEISGQLVNTPWQQSLSLESENKQQTENLDTVWARQKIASLMDKIRTGEVSEEKTKPSVVKLGIDHSIVTKYTSFIAIEETPSKPKEEIAKDKQVPNLMPKGNTMPAPQTATPSTLLMLLGLMMILFSSLMKRLQRARQLITVMTYTRHSSAEEQS